jgi:hypothetical protein
MKYDMPCCIDWLAAHNLDSGEYHSINVFILFGFEILSHNTHEIMFVPFLLLSRKQSQQVFGVPVQ